MKKTSIKKKHNFYIRIILPTFLTISLFITALFLIFIPQFENAIMDRKREMIKELTNSAWSIVDKWYNAELEGEVTREEAQSIAKSQIESLRYGDEQKDYFWITDFYPKMIMHPYRKDLNNKDLSDIKDSHGKILFVEMVKTAKANGGGFVDYMWQWKDDPTRIVPKLSYVKRFENWQWVIGTGIYIEDVSIEIASLEKQIINISIGITIIISLLLLFITYQNIKTEKQRLQAEADLHESREKFKSIVEASTEGLIMILENGQIYFNRTIGEMLGYSDEEIKTLPLAEIFVIQPKISLYDFNTFQMQTDLNGKSEQMETILKKKNGTRINALLIASPISFLNNKGLVLSLKDITTTKKLSNETEQQEEGFKSLANQLNVGLFSASATKKGQLIEINTTGKNILNINFKTDISEISLIDFFENYSEGEKFFSDILKSGFVKNKKLGFINLSGQKIFVSISAVVSKDEENRILSFHGILEDITEQTKREKETENLIYDLQNSVSILNRPIDRFVKEVSRCNFNQHASDAVTIMVKENSDAVLLITDSGIEIGIVTLTDLKNRILTEESNLKSPVHNFMSSPLISLKLSSSIYDALEKLSEKNVHHLLIKNDESKIVGIINSGDLQRAFHLTYLFFIRKIQNAESIVEVKNSHTQAMLIVKGLIKENRNADEITRMTTVIADEVLKRLIQLVIKEIGEPPVSFAYITLGSEGREEQTLATDQDNAIIFDNINSENFESIQSYFLNLGSKVSTALDMIGYKYCMGNVMAKNPQWCQPLSIWKNYFTDWITKAEPKDLLDLKIFFDFRFVYGKVELVDELKMHVNSITSKSSSFFIFMAESIINTTIPEGAQKFKSNFEIKLLMLPIVDLARLYALKNQTCTTNTVKRISLAYEKNIFSQSGYVNLLQIYNFLMEIRFKHQISQISEHITPDNLINPHKLSDVDLVVIKKAVSVIEDFQNKVGLDFKGTLVR